MATFSTVSLMQETPDVVQTFVRYYRNAGAAQMLVYYDGPAPDLRLEGTDAVLVECDAAFWTAACGARPEAVEDRQSAVYEAAYARCGADWLLVVDADEFVFGDRGIPEFLDLIPAEVDAVGLPTAEAVWGPGDDPDIAFGSRHFRLGWPHGRLWRVPQRLVFGRIAGYLHDGLAGHVSGKEFVRVGRRLDWIGNHYALRDGISVTRRAESIDASLGGMFLGHFDAIDYPRWVEKWRRRIDKETVARKLSGPRRRQMSLIAGSIERGEDAARRLFARFYRLTRAQFRALSMLGLAFRREIFVGDPQLAAAAAGTRTASDQPSRPPATSPTMS